MSSFKTEDGYRAIDNFFGEHKYGYVKGQDGDTRDTVLFQAIHGEREVLEDPARKDRVVHPTEKAYKIYKNRPTRVLSFKQQKEGKGFAPAKKRIPASWKRKGEKTGT